MNNNVQTISAYSVINDVIPKINAVEKLVEATVKDIIKTSRIPEQIERYSKLQIEFQLELSMIRTNLEHLLNRYQNELEAVKQSEHNDMLLTLDPYEATALESASARVFKSCSKLTKSVKIIGSCMHPNEHEQVALELETHLGRD